MSETSSDAGLSGLLVRWMADHREQLDAAMAEEASRAIHEEFMMAEGGVLPDRGERLERARRASARAWLRHLAGGLEEVWPEADPGLAERLSRWMTTHPERVEALALEERAALERRGLSGDPEGDRRDVELAAHCRLFAEALGQVGGAIGDEPPPDFGRRVAAWARENAPRRRAVEADAREAWGATAPADDAARMSAAAAEAEPDDARVREAAGVWAHVQVLTEALEHALGDPAPGAA